MCIIPQQLEKLIPIKLRAAVGVFTPAFCRLHPVAWQRFGGFSERRAGPVLGFQKNEESLDPENLLVI